MTAQVALAITLHDPDGRLYTQLQQTLPLLRELFAQMAVNATPETDGRVLTPFAEQGAIVEQQERPEREGILLLGAVRRGVVATALQSGAPFVFYCDGDRLLHWADRYPHELTQVVAQIPAHGFTIFGRTPRAFQTHPRIQRDTERIINHVFAVTSGQTWDITAAARGMSRDAARAIVEGCPDDSIGVDAAWPLFIQSLGEFSMAHVETEGLEFETADRYVPEIERAGGLGAWMAVLDTDPQQWAFRLRLAQLEIQSMTRYAPSARPAVPADSSLVGAAAVPHARSRPIEIVCHRGANQHAPENTYAAAQLCIDWGMDYVEIDVSTSRDGVLYLLHGPAVDKTTDGTGCIQQLSAAEIDRLDAGSWFGPQHAGERVPRLAEFLPWIRGKAKLFIDVKSAAHAPLLELIYQNQLQNDCFFWSGDDEWLRRLYELDSQLTTKVNVRTAAEVAIAQRTYGARIVETTLEHMNHELLDACRARNIKLMLYVRENDPAAYRQVLAWGADMVNLNHGDAFARVAAEWLAQQAQT
jgi:glycerophosphoryl diester phosphodiesterase